MKPPSERIQRGVEWLDSRPNIGDWRSIVRSSMREGTFDMSDTCRCVLGCLFTVGDPEDQDQFHSEAGYNQVTEGAVDSAYPSTAEAAHMGFDLDAEECSASDATIAEEWLELARAWAAEVGYDGPLPNPQY